LITGLEKLKTALRDGYKCKAREQGMMFKILHLNLLKGIVYPKNVIIYLPSYRSLSKVNFLKFVLKQITFI